MLRLCGQDAPAGWRDVPDVREQEGQLSAVAPFVEVHYQT